MEKQHWSTDSKYKQKQYYYQNPQPMWVCKIRFHSIVSHNHSEIKRISQDFKRHTHSGGKATAKLMQQKPLLRTRLSQALAG